MTTIELVVASYAIVIVLGISLLAIIVPIGMAIENVSNRIERKRQVAYRLANQCKGITKKGNQCLRWNDCPNHAN